MAYIAMSLSLAGLALVILGTGSDGLPITLLGLGTALASMLPFKWWREYDPDIHAAIERIGYEDEGRGDG